MDRSSGRASDMPYVEQRRVGEYVFTLMVPGEEDGAWPWVLNRTYGEPHSTFGKTIASGLAPSREDALRLVNAAFDVEAQWVRRFKMMAVVLDTHIHDEILGTPGMAEDLKSLVAAGKLQILTTHVQRDELAATPDATKREALLGLPVPAVPVPTGGAISGRSRIGEARIGDGAADGVDIPAIQKGNLQHAEDALIAVTAAREGCVLVTNDGTLARKMRARAATTEVWDFPTFARRIAELKGHLS